MYIFTNRIISKIAIKVNSKGKFVVPGSGIIIMLRSGYNCFLCHRAFDSRKGQKNAVIVRIKTWERGQFFRQRSAWRVVALLCVLLLAGFGFSRVKTENRSFFKLPRKHFLFTKFYGILRKTFDIARSRNAQGRFWIRRRDDSSQDKSCFSISDRGYGPNEGVDV